MSMHNFFSKDDPAFDDEPSTTAAVTVPQAPKTPTVHLGTGGLYVKAPYEMRHALAAIPGAKWSPQAVAWTYPASPVAAHELHLLLGASAIFDPGALELAGKGAAVAQSSPAKVAALAEAGSLEPLPFDTPVAPWAHQLGMVRFAEPLAAAVWNVGMGAGKTAAALHLIRLRRHERVLVLAPLSVVAAWEKQAKEHAPGAVALLALDHGSSQKRAREAVAFWQAGTEARPAIVVVNYECASTPVFLAAAGALGGLSLVVADEAHKLKAPNGKQSRAIYHMAKHVPYRLALSGTLFPHSPMDAYGVYRFVDAGIFGNSFVAFRSRFAVMGGFQMKQVVGYQNRELFAKRIAPVTYEVSRDVLDLPEATHVERTFHLDAPSATLYKSLRDDFVAEVEGGLVTVQNALSKLLRLSQVASGHVGLDISVEDYIASESQPQRPVREVHRDKEKLLRELLEEIPDDEAVVVFARFRHDLDQIARAAQACGGSAELSGRRNELAAWQAGGPRVLAAQVQSGAEGVDMTRARYCVFYSLDYSLGRYDQALARVHRPGQHRPVTYVHIIAEGTVDRLVRKALTNRRNVVEDVMAEIRSQS